LKFPNKSENSGTQFFINSGGRKNKNNNQTHAFLSKRKKRKNLMRKNRNVVRRIMWCNAQKQKQSTYHCKGLISTIRKIWMWGQHKKPSGSIVPPLLKEVVAKSRKGVKKNSFKTRKTTKLLQTPRWHLAKKEKTLTREAQQNKKINVTMSPVIKQYSTACQKYKNKNQPLCGKNNQQFDLPAIKQEKQSISCQLSDGTQQKKENPCSPGLHPGKKQTKKTKKN